MLVAGSTDWGVEVNLRGARAPFVIGIDRLPELRTLEVGARRRRDRRGAHASPRSSAASPARIPLLDTALPAVRLPPDPQRRHHRRQPRHRLARSATSRPPCWRSRPSVVLAGPDGEREVPLADYFTGYRADRQAARRADPRGADPAAAQPSSPPSTRSPSAASTTSPASPSGFALDVRGRRRSPGPGSVSAASPPRRSAPSPPRRRSRAGRGPRRRSARPPRCCAPEGTPMDDHRASAAYRTAMLGTALLKLYAENRDPDGGAGMSAPVRTPGEPRRRAGAPARVRRRCTSPARRSTPTTSSRARTACCTPTPCRRRTPTPG